jgi:hypothetical protein
MSPRALARGFFSLIQAQKPDANAFRLIRRKTDVLAPNRATSKLTLRATNARKRTSRCVPLLACPAVRVRAVNEETGRSRVPAHEDGPIARWATPRTRHDRGPRRVAAGLDRKAARQAKDQVAKKKETVTNRVIRDGSRQDRIGRPAERVVDSFRGAVSAPGRAGGVVKASCRPNEPTARDT